MNAAYPLAAKLTGKPVGNTVELKAEKSLLLNIKGSSMTAATVSPFGANRLAFEFTDDSGCGGAQMLLSRGR